MKDSLISWTDHTFNPWQGCTKVSPGCDNCYAEAFSVRFGKDIWGAGKPRQRTSEKYWQAPLKWNREAAEIGVRQRVFCASMADVFDIEVSDEWRRDLFELIRATPNLDWLLLTKRPNLIARAVPWGALAGAQGEPWPNVWLGTSIESQRQMWRLDALKRVPAVVHFVSAEPLLGDLAIPRELMPDWVIAGCESMPGKRAGRPSETAWFEHLRDQCAKTGTAFWLKQMAGADGHVHELPELEGRRYTELPRPRLITGGVR